MKGHSCDRFSVHAWSRHGPTQPCMGFQRIKEPADRTMVQVLAHTHRPSRTSGVDSNHPNVFLMRRNVAFPGSSVYKSQPCVHKLSRRVLTTPWAGVWSLELGGSNIRTSKYHTVATQ